MDNINFTGAIFPFSLCHLFLNQGLLRADCIARESSVNGFLSNSKKKKKKKRKKKLLEKINCKNWRDLSNSYVYEVIKTL